MSTAKENPCRKFQANFFNKSKCQNCFKPRELHLLTDQDLTQAKPIYGGWLCLAPEGTDFDNPMQRSRKWQRRFFVLYEHGCLRFALDESPSTLPQGTVNMNLCTDVIDAEPKTGQKNSLCIITPEQEYFIRGENKEIINGWCEQLMVYPRTNKQNQKKKRKVEPTTSQEPGPAKVAVTGSGIPEAEKVPDSSSIIWQEELSQREAEGAAVWSAADLPPESPLPSTGDISLAQGSDAGSVNGDETDGAGPHGSVPQASSDLLSPTGSCSSLGGIPRCLSPAPSDPFPSGSSLLSNGSHISGSVSSLDSDASGSTVTSSDSHPANQRGHSYSHYDAPRSRRLEAEARKAEKRSRYRSPDRQERESVLSPERSRSGVIEKLEALELENPEKMEVEESGRSGGRQGRSEHRHFHREQQRHDMDQGLDFVSTLPPLRRAKSLDRRTTESVMTPDLLNFKKGWMVKLDEQGQWKKYWFVLTDHSLRYYKDSIAEEASDLDGEIDLSTCCNVTEYQAQRNYGFQIHTQEGVHTLSAMTAGIRRNWIQAVMKNVRPSTAPDVASLTEDHGSFSPLESLVRPDVTQDSPPHEPTSVERESIAGVPKSRARERRREGRSKTFDWAEFRPIAQALAQQRAQEAESLQADLGELERSRRREERRKRYESVTVPSAQGTSAKDGGKTDYGSGVEADAQTSDSFGPAAFERQQRMEEAIEQHWQQVESTPIREERRVPLSSTGLSIETAELEQLLENYRRGIGDLKTQLESCHQQLHDSNKHKQELEFQLRTALEREQDIRTGYISPLEPPLGLEADVTPQMKRPELVSSQAQSLTKKYQETKELLKLQELKKRNMQAQLGLSLSHIKEPYFSESKPSSLESPTHELVQKSVSFLLQDSTERIQALEDMTTDKPLSLRELSNVLISNSCSKGNEEKHYLQNILETWKYQQELENEILKKSLARAGESIREYESRLLTIEDLVGKVPKQIMESLKSPYGPLSEIKNHPEATDTSIAILSQRVELLMSENEALKQRCQEIVNQLTEADREIDRLKTELSCHQSGKQHHLVMEELKRLKGELAENQANAIDREYYERELNEKSLRLHEALVTLEELGSTLKDTEKKLQLKEATLKGLGFRADFEDEDVQPEEQQKLKDALEASQAKLLEMETNLFISEQHRLDLEARNRELVMLSQESERVSREKLEQAEDELRMLKETLEVKTVSECVKAGVMHVDDKDLIKQVVKEVEMKSEAISQVLAMLTTVDINVETMLSVLKKYIFGSSLEGPLQISRNDAKLVIEEEFWSQLLVTPKMILEEDQHSCERAVAEQMMAQKRLMLLEKGHCQRADCETVTESEFEKMYKWLDNKSYSLIHSILLESLEAKSNVLKHIAARIESAHGDELHSLAVGSFLGRGETSKHLFEALQEACNSYVRARIKTQHEKELNQRETGAADCPNCPKFIEAAINMESKLAHLQNQLDAASLKSVSGSQTLAENGKEPVGSPDKYLELHETIARQQEELRKVKDGYEQETERYRQEIVKASEALRICEEENAKEINSLTSSMQNLKKEHEQDRAILVEKFDQEMEELRGMMSPAHPEQTSTGELQPLIGSSGQTSTLRERIQELVTQVTVMTQEMRRREEQEDVTTLRLKYEKDLEHLKVEALIVIAVAHL